MDQMRTHFLKSVPSAEKLELSNIKVIKMAKSEHEIWKSYPDIVGIEVSTMGRVRTLDRVTSSERVTRFIKGRILKQRDNGNGYLKLDITIDGKQAMKYVHRLVAQTFIPNPDNLPQVNHRDCNRKNNNVENLEWCDNSYNVQYREKFGDALGHPLFAIKLDTLEVLNFHSQQEAGQVLGVSAGNINNVIKGKYKQTGGFWFVNADDNGAGIVKQKIYDIKKRISETSNNQEEQS